MWPFFDFPGVSSIEELFVLSFGNETETFPEEVFEKVVGSMGKIVQFDIR